MNNIMHFVRTGKRLLLIFLYDRHAAEMQSRYSTESLLLILQQGTFVHETNHLSRDICAQLSRWSTLA
jgi:hypothetical protein